MCSRSQRGQSLIDMIIGTTIIGFFAVSIWGTLVGFLGLGAQTNKRIQAIWVANSIMEEIMAFPADDPESPTGTLSPEDGESGRSDFDDVDDFNDYSYPTADHYGFTASVEVLWAVVPTTGGAITTPAASPTNYKQVKVTISGAGLDPSQNVELKTLVFSTSPGSSS